MTNKRIEITDVDADELIGILTEYNFLGKRTLYISSKRREAMKRIKEALKKKGK